MLAWDFDAFLLDNDERVSLVVTALALLGFVEQFSIPARKLSAFTAKVAQVMGAHRLPYHNFIHAVDVFQSTLVSAVQWVRWAMSSDWSERASTVRGGVAKRVQ